MQTTIISEPNRNVIVQAIAARSWAFAWQRWNLTTLDKPLSMSHLIWVSDAGKFAFDDAGVWIVL